MWIKVAMCMTFLCLFCTEKPIIKFVIGTGLTHQQIIMTMSCIVEDLHDNGREMEENVVYVVIPGIVLR